MNRIKDVAIQNYARRLTAVILDLVQPEVAPFDPPTSKTLLEPNMKWIRLSVAEMVIRNFPKLRPSAIWDLV